MHLGGWPLPVRHLLLVMGMACASGSMAVTPPASRDDYRQLDGEVQAIREDLLDIQQELSQLEALSRSPQAEQLVVLLSVANDSPGRLEQVSLLLDGAAVSQHLYTEDEGMALREGGVHRIFAGGLGSGRHLLEVSVRGQLPRSRTFQEVQRFTLDKKPGRTFMEVHLEPGRTPSKPEISLRAWTP
jgi:hypothetical protein